MSMSLTGYTFLASKSLSALWEVKDYEMHTPESNVVGHP